MSARVNWRVPVLAFAVVSNLTALAMLLLEQNTEAAVVMIAVANTTGLVIQAGV